jgi:hypothetical protein
VSICAPIAPGREIIAWRLVTGKGAATERASPAPAGWRWPAAPCLFQPGNYLAPQQPNLLLLYVDFSIHFMDWIGLSRVLFYQQNIVWVGCQLFCNVFSTIMAEEKLIHHIIKSAYPQYWKIGQRRSMPSDQLKRACKIPRNTLWSNKGATQYICSISVAGRINQKNS